MLDAVEDDDDDVEGVPKALLWSAWASPVIYRFASCRLQACVPLKNGSRSTVFGVLSPFGDTSHKRHAFLNRAS